MTSTSLLALVQSEVSSHKATSSPESPSNVSPGDYTEWRTRLFVKAKEGGYVRIAILHSPDLILLRASVTREAGDR